MHLRLKRATFTRCSAPDGGGMRALNSFVEMSDVVFDRCEATEKGGGLILLRTPAGYAATLYNVSFTGCKAGGGIPLGGGGSARPAIELRTVASRALLRCAAFGPSCVQST